MILISNALTIGRNSSNIANAAGDLVINTQGAAFGISIFWRCYNRMDLHGEIIWQLTQTWTIIFEDKLVVKNYAEGAE